jgi:GNAT superfamily N-acetyltransferase
VSGALFRVTPFGSEFDSTVFCSGSEPLDRYLKEQVSQDIRRRVTACFVALTPDEQIAGYYTLASSNLLLSNLPVDVRKRLPRYPTVPTVLMGRLAVDQRFQGKGLGAALLADAMERAIRSEIASYALLVNAKDDSAARFYGHHGFIALPDSPLSLFLPLATAAKLIREFKG